MPETAAPAEAPAGEKAKPAPRTRRKATEPSGQAVSEASAQATAVEAEPAAPKKRAPARRKTAVAAEPDGEAPAGE
jgi:ribonuclease E